MNSLSDLTMLWLTSLVGVVIFSGCGGSGGSVDVSENIEGLFTYEQQRLADFMGDLSQKYYEESWADDAENWLWEEMNSLIGTGPQLEADEIFDLNFFHDEAGGWIYLELLTEERVFVPTDVWVGVYPYHGF